MRAADLALADAGPLVALPLTVAARIQVPLVWPAAAFGALLLDETRAQLAATPATRLVRASAESATVSRV